MRAWEEQADREGALLFTRLRKWLAGSMQGDK